MSDEEQQKPERASRTTTMRPPPPPAPPRLPPRPGKPARPLVRLEHPLPNDRPTPRSTVIPRLPPQPLPSMRPPLQTLIFHGAPPVPPRPPPPLRPSRDETLEVHSVELLEDDDEDERPTPFHEGMAKTDRPPPPVAPAPKRVSREVRILAAIAAAIALPSAAALVLLAEPASHTALVATKAPAPPPSAAPAAPSRARGTCALDASGRLLARRALVKGGVEAAALDERVAFAAMTSNKSGTAFELDARTLLVKSSAKVVTTDPVRHVVPELGDEGPIEAQADTGGARTIADAEGDLAVAARDGFVVWGPRDGDGMVRLWKLPWPQVVDAPRVVALGTSGERALAFRRAGAVWVGSFRGGQATSDLTRISTSDFVGAPALDAQGDEAVLAWAQRDSASAPWGIRWARWTPHAGPGEVHELTLPAGGPGDRAMAPSVAALGGGRVLLAWTEAGHGRNQVRAQVFDASDRAIGDALAVSPLDAVAGQEQIALTDSGHGAIAYLVARHGAFELRATAIDCAVQ